MIWHFAKRYKFFLTIQAVVAAIYLVRPEVSLKALRNSAHFSIEVMAILPPTAVLLGLLDSWIPSRVIESRLGKESGMIGWLAAVLAGTVAAGPLFAAFPIAASLLGKGARTANIAIFLGSWATIKVPLLIMESQFLGLKFSVLRFALTLPLVILTGLLMEKLAPLDKKRSPSAWSDVN